MRTYNNTMCIYTNIEGQWAPLTNFNRLTVQIIYFVVVTGVDWAGSYTKRKTPLGLV